MSGSLVVVENAVKSFPVGRSSLRLGHIVALDRVSLEVCEGQTIGLVGESGCGKSTLGRCILHLLALDKGVIRVRGQEVQGMSEKEFRPLRRQLQMVFQNVKMSFNPAMMIGQSLVDAMRLYRDLTREDKMARALDLLDCVQLSARFASQFPSEVSGGELQRAALARALAVEPRFIFLDEPTSDLDMSIRGQIVNLLLDIQERNAMAYIFVSHDLRLIQYVADELHVMYMGQIVEVGKRDEVFESPLHPYTRALLAATLVGRDERQQTRQSALKGEVMSQRWVGQGCKLFSRCAQSTARCSEEPQILRTVYPGRQVRCWRISEG